MAALRPQLQVSNTTDCMTYEMCKTLPRRTNVCITVAALADMLICHNMNTLLMRLGRKRGR